MIIKKKWNYSKNFKYKKIYYKSEKLTFRQKEKKLIKLFLIFVDILILVIFKYKKPDIFSKNFKEIYISGNNNNKGFLKINTKHKGKYETYNYEDNIIVVKDLYNNITYTPITESNSIIKSEHIFNDSYFELCDNKTLLDNTKYKRSTKPLISVVIPYYNKDKFSIYIPLRSIQNQSLKHIEIIIVDDGSSENIINKVLEEMKNDNRIILLKHKINKGTLMSRVDGVRYASGEYILTIDQDDLYIDNLLFENIYKKAKELNVDILHFAAFIYHNKDKIDPFTIGNRIKKNVLITQPELKISFFDKVYIDKNNTNKLGDCNAGGIWDKLIKRNIYLEGIKDLGDEYLNHRVFLYEDTLMKFELSQVAYSYYFYDYFGYRLNGYIQGQTRDDTSNGSNILAMNQLLFIKLLLYKVPTYYDRYHIFMLWGFAWCGSEARYTEEKDIDLLKEVLEVIYELERIYKNTDKRLLECANEIKRNNNIDLNN